MHGANVIVSYLQFSFKPTVGGEKGGGRKGSTYVPICSTAKKNLQISPNCPRGGFIFLLSFDSRYFRKSSRKSAPQIFIFTPRSRRKTFYFQPFQNRQKLLKYPPPLPEKRKKKIPRIIKILLKRRCQAIIFKGQHIFHYFAQGYCNFKKKLVENRTDTFQLFWGTCQHQLSCTPLVLLKARKSSPLFFFKQYDDHSTELSSNLMKTRKIDERRIYKSRFQPGLPTIKVLAANRRISVGPVCKKMF